MAKKKIGVILSGSGVMDGSEIHESVIALLALDRAGAEAVCMAPNIEQTRVWNHLTDKEATGETRNVLVESARIARGNIKDLAKVHAKDIDAVVMPGGFGAALNLCTFGLKGPDCEINPEVARLLEEMRKAGKPIGAICIAPAAVARALGA
ncbi:MAG: isoprenoid biosynthesis glyoxalase ElbB, partial [Myxococcales bacterium]|nr:isoprenoid biosynthesis glyoxalase ElbB [Myxococcales bacterium]